MPPRPRATPQHDMPAALWGVTFAVSMSLAITGYGSTHEGVTAVLKRGYGSTHEGVRQHSRGGTAVLMPLWAVTFAVSMSLAIDSSSAPV